GIRDKLVTGVQTCALPIYAARILLTTALLELISPDIVFRGSIGTAVNGIEEFKQYVSKIRAAFPDFHNHIEELIGEGGKIVARRSEERRVGKECGPQGGGE